MLACTDIDVSDDWYYLKYRTANWYSCSEQLQIAHMVALHFSLEYVDLNVVCILMYCKSWWDKSLVTRIDVQSITTVKSLI